jgi:competence protein ComEC
MVAADGRTFAVRGANGTLAIHHTGGDTFATREWLSADADGRDVKDRALGQGIACDPSGCIGRLADGSLAAYDLRPDALEEDCRRAALIVSLSQPPPDCAAMVIDRNLLRERGALALRRVGKGFIIDSARAPNFDRPWGPQMGAPKRAPRRRQNRCRREGAARPRCDAAA